MNTIRLFLFTVLLFTMSAFALGETLLRSAARRRLNALTLTVTAPDGSLSVRMTGPWWDWDANNGPVATSNGDGTWTVTFDQAPTEDMRYLWVVDAVQENLIDNAAGAECTAEIDGGSLFTDSSSWANRVLVVGSGDAANTYDACAGTVVEPEPEDPSIPDSPTPTLDAADVISLFSNAYTDVTVDNFNPSWGQSTQVVVTDVITYTNLDYQGTDFEAQDVSTKEFFHVDFYTEDATDLQMFVINALGPEKGYSLTDQIVFDQWVSVDIPLYAYNVVDLTGVNQLKVVGNGAVVLDNLYFHGERDAPVPPSSVTFSVDMTGVDLDGEVPTLQGTFNTWCGACNPMSDEDGDNVWTLTIPLLNADYEYKYAIGNWVSQETVPADCFNTIGANRRLVLNSDTVLETDVYNGCAVQEGPEQQIPTAPVPTEALDVLSIFSTTYGKLEGTDFDPDWGQATNVDSTGDNLVYTNLDYQGTQFTAQDVSPYLYLNIDYYVVQSTILNFYLDGETSVALDVSTAGQWNNVQIQLIHSDNVDLAYEFIVDGNGEVAFNNIYFGGVAVGGVAVLGCTDPTAENYDSAATQDDGNCEYAVYEHVTYCATEVTHFNIDNHDGSILLTVENSGADSMTVTATSVNNVIDVLIIENVRGGGTASEATITDGVATVEITWAAGTMPATTSFAMLWSDEASGGNLMISAGEGTDGLGIIDTSNVCDNGGDTGATIALPVDFEEGAYDIYGFDGGVASLEAGPDSLYGVSLKYVKDAGQNWAGVWINLDTAVDAANGEIITADVYSTVARDITLKLDLANVERVASHTGSGWLTLSYDFTGAMPADQTKIAFFNDLSQSGDGTGAWTIYIDNLAQSISVAPPGPVDSDNDGVNDDEDAFPNDASETVDSDNDGVGDNADFAPNDPNIQKGPEQQVSVSGDPIAFRGVASVTISYDVSNKNAELSGLGLRVHYDSTVLQFRESTNVLDNDLFSYSSVGINDDYDNDDDNDSTDKYVTANWASLFGYWPGTTLPKDLLTLDFIVADDVPWPTTTIGFSASSTATGYDFVGTAYVMRINLPTTGNLVTDGTFDEATSTTWYGNAYNPVNGVNKADIAAAGDPWDVNLSGYVNVVAGADYTLAFDVTGADRTIVAGIGQSVAPYLSHTDTVTLSASTQTIVMHLTAKADGTGVQFGGDTTRVIFDMGADTGAVNIDNVVLTAGHTGTVNLGTSGDTGGDTGGGTQLTITTTVCETASEVRMTGPWWGWDANSGAGATDNGDGTWTFTFDPAPTANMEYLLVVDRVQENLVAANTASEDWSCTPITDYVSYANRQWVVGSEDVVNTYGTCGNCGTDPPAPDPPARIPRPKLDDKWHLQIECIAGLQDCWANYEQQHYTDRSENAYVSGGHLHIVAKKEEEEYESQGVKRAYTSARLNSKYDFKYGTVKVRAKLPKKSGLWPAIWTLGSNINEVGVHDFGRSPEVPWRNAGEIDIMEQYGTQNFVGSAMHGPLPGVIELAAGGTIPWNTQELSPSVDEFHVYSMDWTETTITFKVDDVAYKTVTAPSDKTNWPFDHEHFLLLNVAVEPDRTGGIDSNFVSGEMVVDYVRIYGENGDLNWSDEFDDVSVSDCPGLKEAFQVNCDCGVEYTSSGSLASVVSASDCYGLKNAYKENCNCEQ